MVTNDPLNWVCVSNCERNSVSELMMLFVEPLVHRKVFMLAVEESMGPMKAEIFAHTKEQ